MAKTATKSTKKAVSKEKTDVSVETPESAGLIEVRPIKSLIPYARNARTHSEEQVSQLMGSILEWGWTNPILVDANGIVAGHGRLAAATRLYDSGRVIRLPNGKELPKETVPVLDCTGWTEAQRKAYILADNKLALNAGWDYELLAVELDELRDFNFDIDLVGFQTQELNALIGTPILPPIAPGKTDAGEEYKGMPEFNQGDETAHRRIVVNFANDSDVADFFLKIGQPYTDKTRSIWFPPQKWHDTENKRYGEGGGEDDDS